MQVTLKDVSSVKKVLHVEVPEEDVVKELNNAYATLKKTAKVKGFRPGKAPRSVLERLYKKDVNADVASRLIQESFAEALKETDLNVVGRPSIDPPALEGQGPYVYEAEVEIRPEIADIEFKGLDLKKTVYKTEDSQVQAQLEMLQKGAADLKPIDPPRPAQEGDSVMIDYEGFKDGKPYTATQRTENYTMKLGNAQIAAEVDAGIVGMSADESKEITAKFSDNHFNKHLAGQEITFAVTVKDVREEVLKEINEDFAKQVSKFETLEELKEDIRQHLQTGFDKRTEQELNEQCFKALLAKTDFEVPDTMVEYELEGILKEAERSFAYRNTSLEDMGYTREGLAEQYREVAEKQVRRHMILGKIIEQEALGLSDEEVDEGLQGIADSYGQPVDQLKAFYEKDADQLEYLKHTLLEKKAAKLIIDNGRIEEVEPVEEPPEADDSTSGE